ncbi:DUF3784 domain-containing protein [Bacillus mycoides]|uniref:DUF3784 domain-containing protein n=1 Tax=Bacillus mycoides TaxID=1405 RepID=UPI003D21D926
MFIAQICVISVALFLIVMGIFLLNKKGYRFIAGYSPEKVKDHDKFGRVNGIFVIIAGVLAIAYAFFIDIVPSFVFIIVLSVHSIVMIIANQKL